MSLTRTMIKIIRARRLLYIQVLFTVLAFLVMVVLSYYFARKIVNSSLLRYADRVSALAQVRIESDLRKSETTLGSFAQSINSMVLYGFSADELQYYTNNQTSYLHETEVLELEINDLYGYFADLHGESSFFIGDPHVEMMGNHDPTQMQWYKNSAAAGDSVVKTLPYRYEGTGDVVITYTRGIVDGEDRTLGVVGLDVRIDKIGEHIVETSG